MVGYEVYINDYNGCSIPELEFYSYAARAEDQLNCYKRIYTVEAPSAKAEELAVCAMADVIYSIAAAQNGGGAVSSATIGSVSVSYGGAASVDLSRKGQARELYEAACRYLDIYRG